MLPFLPCTVWLFLEEKSRRNPSFVKLKAEMLYSQGDLAVIPVAGSELSLLVRFA
jgi:hypothetical protein